jgi:hypothetical protein
MGTLGNLELPAQMSPCLQLFIESLFDEVGVKHGGSLYQKRETQPALPELIKTSIQRGART